MTTAVETMHETAHETSTESDTPSRKERRRAAKAAAKLQRKLAKAEKKAWKRARPKKSPWVTPILWVSDAKAYSEWCVRAFGFEIIFSDEGDKPTDATRMWALRHRRGHIMVGQTKSPELGAPGEGGKASVTQYVYVADVDELASRAAGAGARVLFGPKDEHWGDRCVGITDSQGHSWMFATHKGGCMADEACDQADGGEEPAARQAKA